MTGRLLLALLAALAGFLAGTLWGPAGTPLPAERPVPPGPVAAAAAEPVLEPPDVPDEPASGLPDAPLASPLTLHDIAKITSEFDQSAALYALAAPLDTAGLVELLAEAERALSSTDYVGGTSLLIGRYAELDFAGALDYALAHGGTARNAWLRAVFHARARLDLEDAVATAETLVPAFRQAAGSAILRASELPAMERADIASRLGLTGSQVAASAADPQAAWAAAQTISNPMQRVQAQMRAAITWAQSDPVAALAATAELSNNSMRTAAQGQILAQLALEDPNAAMDWLQSLGEDSHRNQLTQIFASSLAAQDMELAARLAERLPADMREQIDTMLWSRRAGADPEGAANWISRLAPSRQGSAAGQLLGTIGVMSPESAERFMANLPEQMLNSVEPAYVSILARTEPARAAARVERIENADQRREAASTLIAQWTSENPRAAARWLEGLPEADSAHLYFSFAASWARTDAAGARRYAQGMARGSSRDSMVTGLVATSDAANIDTFAGLVGLISNAQRRQQAEKILESRQAGGN